MPTNKLWIEHTERAAWDSVEALRERLSKAESRLQALAAGVERVPELLDALEDAKQKHAPDAHGYDGDRGRAGDANRKPAGRARCGPRRPSRRVVSFAPLPARPRLGLRRLRMTRIRTRRATTTTRSWPASLRPCNGAARLRPEPARDLNRLLALAENKLDDLTELEGAALREAALELAISGRPRFTASLEAA